MVVLLQRQPATGLDDDAFDLVAVTIIGRLITDISVDQDLDRLQRKLGS